MAQNEVQTVYTGQDKLMLVFSVACAIGGALAYQILSSESFFIRLGVVLLGIVLATGGFFLSQVGRRFFGFTKDSLAEVKRVVWPARREAVQMTAVVFVFVLIMSLYLLLVDKTLEWVFYDLILGWAI